MFAASAGGTQAAVVARRGGHLVVRDRRGRITLVGRDGRPFAPGGADGLAAFGRGGASAALIALAGPFSPLVAAFSPWTLPGLAPWGDATAVPEKVTPPASQSSFRSVIGGDATWGLPVVPLGAAFALLVLLFLWLFTVPGRPLQPRSPALGMVVQNSQGALALAAGAAALCCAVVFLAVAVL